MADEGTVRTLVLVGAILQFLFIIYYLYMILFWLPNLLPLIIPPEVEWIIPLLMGVYYFIYAIFIVIGIILAIIWLLWRTTPLTHRTGLIVTGILGLLFAGFIPGLLVLIAGIIAPKQDKA
ncbi:MAG: hypothetical protein ACFFDU_05575 [Candidatus Thorarchaeota archaeon]